MKTMIPLFMLFSSAAFAAEERLDAHHVYRLDFVIAENDAGKAAGATTCTLNLEERRTGEIKLGANVALAGTSHGTTMRADVGLTLRATIAPVGEDLLLEEDIEITAATDSQSFRKMSAKGNALIAQGKPALVTSVEDPVSHRHYQVTVTATKLR